MNSSEYASGNSYKKNRKYTLGFVILLFIIGTVLSLSGRQGSVTSQVDVEKLGVMGSYGETIFIPLEDITDVQLVDELDFGTAVDAEESGNTMCGTYENDAYGTYELRVYMKKSPFIVVAYGDGDILVFNQGSKKLTQNIYEDLI